MRRLLVALAGLGLVMMAACGGHAAIPASSISIYNAMTDVLISTTADKGAITVINGDDFHFKVIRLVSDGSGTHTSDVTSVCWFVFSTPGMASANTLGVLHGDSPGVTTLEVKFQPTPTDPIDHCWLDVTISD